MRKYYRWGIIGAGHIAEKFCTALNFTEGAQVYAVASRDAAKGKDFGARHKAVVVYDNYEALMQDEKVDIIYIAIPHVFHYAQTMACLQHGKPVLCEKPLSLSYQHTKEMIDVAKEKQLFFMEGMWTACMPAINKIRSLIAEGLIGEVKYLSADFGFTAPVNLEGRLYNKQLGGGAMMDVGVYPLYLATAILGEPQQVKLLSNLTKTGVDEYVNLSLQYANGASAQLIASIVFQTDIEATIIGNKGRINIKSPWFKATEFSVLLNDGSSQQYNLPHQSNGFEYEIKEVMHCLENDLLQSEKVPHQLSLWMAKITGEVLEQAGVDYE